MSLPHYYKKINGVRWHYRRSLTIDPSVPTLLLIHGLVVSGDYLVPLGRIIGDVFNVYIPDFPGYGESENPLDVLNVQDSAHALKDFLDYVNIEKPILFGNSFGSQIISEFALQFPEKILAGILQGPTIDRHFRNKYTQIHKWLADSPNEPAFQHKLVFNDVRRAGLLRAKKVFEYALADKIEDKAKQIQTPMLIIRGSKDSLVSQEWVEDLALLFPLGDFRVIPGKGHTISTSGPLQLSRIIQAYITDLTEYETNYVQNRIENTIKGEFMTSSNDPKDKFETPPFPEQSQQMPGNETKMTPTPDYGLGTYKGSGKLDGKTALITGGDSGIGRAVAYAFACEGADILISYLNEETDAQETVQAVEATGKKCVAMAGDISSEKHCKKLIDKMIKEYGKMDILINNAAYQNSYQSILDIPFDEFEQAYAVNVFAMFHITKAALPHMKPGASIINTTSIQANSPSASLLPYASTKGAITNFTKALSQELIEKGIRVNAVAPGPVWTPLITSTMPAEKYMEFGKQTPIKRPAMPVELSPVYVLLASDQASYINGEIYHVTGGQSSI